jgi:uncharacterized protein
MTQLGAVPSVAAADQGGVVDCDVHNAVPAQEVLRPYLADRWRRHLDEVGTRTYLPYLDGYVYPKVSPGGGARTDAWPPSGGLPGSDLEFMREQLLDPLDIEYAILNCLFRAAEQRNDEFGAALARAVNEWQVEHWLEKDHRLRASITVTFEAPDLAAEEIRRIADDARFVQVMVFPRTREPLGRRRYWPMYEAAVERGLPIGIHFASTTGAPVTPAGWPSFYIEDHTAMAVAFQAQAASLLISGVFDRFPELRVVLIEGGFGWVPPLLYRLDGLYHRLRCEVPDLERLPSEYFNEHFRLTTQPMEEPERRRDLLGLITDLPPHTPMFSTDYPHWDFDHPQRAFQAKLPDAVRDRILRENAREFYRFQT